MKKLKRKSKTIRYNAAWGAISASMLVVFAENQELMQEYIPPWAYLIVIMINSGVGVYLRTVTSTEVEPIINTHD